jgi:glycosyltransferase involved in cell wall biosynthesis
VLEMQVNKGDNLEHAAISIIIPTYNRSQDLCETLNTLLNQSVKANEIIIVDDSDNDESQSLIISLKQDPRQKNLIYIRNVGPRSITVARNAGFKKASGDIILFLDDDVILHKDYLLGIREVFEAHPNALGAQGWLVQEVHDGSVNYFLRVLARAFYLGHTVNNQCRVFSSTNVTYPHTLDATISCEWLHGCNSALHRKALREFDFDENLREYTWKEDLDISYRIHKRYPGSLYITPRARLIHKESPAGRRPRKQIILIKESYDLYLFFKDFDSTVKDRAIFIWSKLGSFFFLLFSMKEKGIRYFLTDSIYRLEAQLFCIRYIKEIQKGDLNFMQKNHSILLTLIMGSLDILSKFSE